MTAGTVLELWRHPVKSMAGERVAALRVDERGAGGDRTHALWWTIGGKYRTVSAHHAAPLLAWSAAYPNEDIDPGDPPLAVVTAPGGERFMWDDLELPGRLTTDLGRDIDLRRDLRGQQDVEQTLLVTVAASLDVLSSELERALEVRRFRPNVHLSLDAEPFAESTWPAGTELHFDGGVVLSVLEPCDRCSVPTRDPETLEADGRILRTINDAHDTFFGIRCTVAAAGTIAVGETVTAR